MSDTIQPDDLASAIMDNLRAYTDEVTDGIKKAEDLTAKECKSNLEADSPAGVTHKYKKGWKVTVTYESAMEKRTVIHNKEYRLTHLLENGHVIRNEENGASYGRTRAFPHIKKNEEKANADFERRVEEVIKSAGH